MTNEKRIHLKQLEDGKNRDRDVVLVSTHPTISRQEHLNHIPNDGKMLTRFAE